MRDHIVLLIGMFLLITTGAASGGTLNIGPGEAVTYGTEQVRHWSINASAFIQDDPAVWERNMWLVYATSSGHYLITPLHLPDGATVLQMNMTSYDQGTSRFTAGLYRTEVGFTASQVAVATVSSTTGHGDNLYVNSSGALSVPIDNSAYTYYIIVSGFNGSNTHQLSAITITYSVTRPLP